MDDVRSLDPRSAPLPAGWKVVGTKEAAFAVGVSERQLQRVCEAGRVWCYRLFNGTSKWRVVVNERGEPVDPPTSEAGALSACS